MSIEAMKQALVALENGKRVRAGEGGTLFQPDLEDAAMKALCQAIEEAAKHECETCAAKRKRLMDAGFLKSPLRGEDHVD